MKILIEVLKEKLGDIVFEMVLLYFVFFTDVFKDVTFWGNLTIMLIGWNFGLLVVIIVGQWKLKNNQKNNNINF